VEFDKKIDDISDRIQQLEVSLNDYALNNELKYQENSLNDVSWKLDRLIADHYSKDSIDKKLRRVMEDTKQQYVAVESYDKTISNIGDKIKFLKQGVQAN
jgi:hypothetical protein